eukprot:6178134-Amphidinium_carterae.1
MKKRGLPEGACDSHHDDIAGVLVTIVDDPLTSAGLKATNGEIEIGIEVMQARIIWQCKFGGCDSELLCNGSRR